MEIVDFPRPCRPTPAATALSVFAGNGAGQIMIPHWPGLWPTLASCGSTRRSVRRLSRCVAIAAALSVSVDAAAQQPTPQRLATNDTGLHQVALTVSGGVSLGSYQAGATWAFIYVLRSYGQFRAAWNRDSTSRDPNLAPPRPYVLDVLTGASAGNVNAVLAAVEYCAAAAPRQPEKSLFWRAWTPIGFRELLDDDRRERDLAVFSRRAFDTVWADVRKRLEDRHVRNCDLLLGITTTKLTPHLLPLADGLTVPVQRFSGVFRLVAADSAGPLAFAIPRPADLPKELTEILVLDPTGDDRNRRPTRLSNRDVALGFSSVQRLVEASGSFPIAFAPRRVSYRLLDDLRSPEDRVMQGPCVWKNSNEQEECESARSDLFVDGGVFDNRPLNLALGLSRAIDERKMQLEFERGQVLVDSLKAQATRDCSTTDVPNPAALDLADTIVAFSQQLAQTDSAIRADSVKVLTRPDSQLVESTRRKVERRSAIMERLTGDVARFRTLRGQPNQPPIRHPCGVIGARLLAVVDSVTDATGRPSHGRLIYFIDDDARRPGATEIEATATQASQPAPGSQRREPPAGIAAAMRVVSSAFQTGQNGELRLFATRVGEEQLSVNSRYPPLMADHLGHFGAFMAKTFREHDFYAGVYDGLRSTFRELYCRHEADSSKAGKREALKRANRCEVAWLKFVLSQRALSMAPEGEAVIDRIFAHEQAKKRDSIPAGANQKTWALVTLVDANFQAQAANALRCVKRGVLIEDPLCSKGGLVTVMHTWREILRQSPSRTRVLCQGFNRDPEACRLVHDVRAVYHEIITEFLGRLWRAELALDLKEEIGYPTSVAFPLFAQRAFSDQFRTCWRSSRRSCATLNPRSSDVLGGPWYDDVGRLLPASVAGLRNGDARWLEWRPTLFIAPGFAAILPMQVIRREKDVRPAIGGGLTYMPSTPWVTSASFSWIGEKETRPTIDLTVAFLSGVIRLGFRDQPRGVRSFVRHLTLGVGDANGVTTRFLAWVERGLEKRVRGQAKAHQAPPVVSDSTAAEKY
jgi:predicted acylesterase/phospholipase RssA